MRIGVHKNRPVALPPANGKLVHAQDTRRLDRRFRDCSLQAQQRRSASRHRQTFAVAAARSPTKREANGFKHRPLTVRSVGVPACQHRRLLDEGFPRTV